VFSIGPVQPITPEALYLADKDVSTALNSSDEPHKHSMVKNLEIHRVKKVKPVAKPSAAPAPIEKKPHAPGASSANSHAQDSKPKEKPKEKAKEINSFFKSGPSGPESVAKPANATVKSAPAKAKAPTKSKKAKFNDLIDPDEDEFVASKPAKLAPDIIDPDEDVFVARKPTKSSARVIVDSDSDDEPVVPPKTIEKPAAVDKPSAKPVAKKVEKPVAKTAKASPKKAPNGLEDMFDDDEPTIPAPALSTVPPAVPAAAEPQDDAVAPAPAAPTEKRRKRKRIITTQTTQDEKGYMCMCICRELTNPVTRDVSDYVSTTDDEQIVVKKPLPKPKPVTKDDKSPKGKKGGNQSTLLSFFGRK